MANESKKGGKQRRRASAALLKKRGQILDLHSAGASIREISDHLIANGETGAKRANVGKILKEALDDLIEDNLKKAKHHVTLELEKLRRVELAHFSKLLKATTADEIEKLTRAFERVWKRRDSLLGLNKPEKIEHSGPDGGPLEANIRVILPTAAPVEDVADEEA